MTKLLYRLTYALLLASVYGVAQTTEKSVYDYNAAFGHGFYTNNGTQTRSASESLAMPIGKTVLTILFR